MRRDVILKRGVILAIIYLGVIYGVSVLAIYLYRASAVKGEEIFCIDLGPALR